MHTVSPAPLWSPTQVAEHLGVPLKTVYKWRSIGTGPRSMKIGKHLRYRPADVEGWLDRRE